MLTVGQYKRWVLEYGVREVLSGGAPETDHPVDDRDEPVLGVIGIPL